MFMEIVSYTAFRQNLASFMDKVNDDHLPVLITRQHAAPAILISLEDFKAFEETAYLMQSPRNAERLQRSVDALRRGHGHEQPLLEE
jgi:antitoxin YefM